MYDDPDNITPDEAKSVYRTYQLHRDEIDRVERSFGVTVDGEAAARNRLAQANRDFPALVNEYGSIPNIADALAPARTALLGELRQRHPDLADRLTDANFDAGRIYLDAGRDLRDQDEVDLQYPIDSGSTRTNIGITLTGPSRVGVQPQAHPPGLDEPDHQRGIEDDRQGMNQPQPRPSDDPFADRHIAALMAGDSDLADRIAVEFSQTPEGQQLAQLGDQLLAQQQALEQQQLEERERARQAPVLQM
ncbi:hypothetical protein ACW5F0_14290 [Luteimonas sp. A534]